MTERATKFGSLQGDLSGLKDKGDFWLTRVPGLYLSIERFREWVNWDKRVYLSFIRPGDVVVDVGANVGAHTVFFSHLVGARGSVLSFEPLPENIAAMRALLARRARFDNVTIVQSAVGNPGDATTAVLRVPGSDSTQASLQPQLAGSWEREPDIRSLTCPITSLDADPRVGSLERISFIKIDVEGGELDTLKGAAGTIVRHRPLVHCEAYEKWTRPFGYGPSDLMQFARSLGYREARVITDGMVHAHDLDSKIPERWFATSSDVLFVLDEHRHLLRRFDRRYLERSRAIAV
ncbi:MAG: FkbM family methyltransferase [Gemmatimonadaceae bacterium]